MDVAMQLEPIQRRDLCATVDAIDGCGETMLSHRLVKGSPSVQRYACG
jgi:hypothetical protein